MFYSALKGLAEKLVKVVVELKNDVKIEGNINAVDCNLNVVLTNVKVEEVEGKVGGGYEKVKNCFIRGNLIRYIHFNKNEVEYELIEEACRKEHEIQ